MFIYPSELFMREAFDENVNVFIEDRRNLGVSIL